MFKFLVSNTLRYSKYQSLIAFKLHMFDLYVKWDLKMTRQRNQISIGSSYVNYCITIHNQDIIILWYTLFFR